jgi:hypothetical protein
MSLFKPFTKLKHLFAILYIFLSDLCFPGSLLSRFKDSFRSLENLTLSDKLRIRKSPSLLTRRRLHLTRSYTFPDISKAGQTAYSVGQKFPRLPMSLGYANHVLLSKPEALIWQF